MNAAHAKLVAARDAYDALRLEAVSALKVKTPKLDVPQVLLSDPNDDPLFTMNDDFGAATRRLKADRALDDEG